MRKLDMNFSLEGIDTKIMQEALQLKEGNITAIHMFIKLTEMCLNSVYQSGVTPSVFIEFGELIKKLDKHKQGIALLEKKEYDTLKQGFEKGKMRPVELRNIPLCLKRVQEKINEAEEVEVKEK